MCIARYILQNKIFFHKPSTSCLPTWLKHESGILFLLQLSFLLAAIILILIRVTIDCMNSPCWKCLKVTTQHSSELSLARDLVWGDVQTQHRLYKTWHLSGMMGLPNCSHTTFSAHIVTHIHFTDWWKKTQNDCVTSQWWHCNHDGIHAK